MKTRTILATIATVALLLGSTSAAFAWHGGNHNGGHYGNAAGGYGQGAGAAALSPEKQQAIDVIVKESNSRIMPLMEQLDAKRMELDALSGNPNVKPDTISKLVNEIAALRGQIRTESEARNAKISAEGGVAYGRGYGMRGMRGNCAYGNGGGMRGGHGGHGGNGSNCNWR